MKEIVILLLTTILLTTCQSVNEKGKILNAIEQRLEIDIEEYKVEYTEHAENEVGITLTHKTHLPMIKAEERRYGDKHFPSTGDVCGKCRHVLYDRNTSEIVNVMGMQ